MQHFKNKFMGGINLMDINRHGIYVTKNVFGPYLRLVDAAISNGLKFVEFYGKEMKQLDFITEVVKKYLTCFKTVSTRSGRLPSYPRLFKRKY